MVRKRAHWSLALLASLFLLLGVVWAQVPTGIHLVDDKTLGFAWDIYTTPDSVDGFALFASTDSVAFALVDTVLGGTKTQMDVPRPDQSQWYYLTAFVDSLHSGPSNVVYWKEE